MQGNWKNRVQQQEVTPPEGVWEAIALALEASEKKPDWQKKVYHAAVEPPAGTWEDIALALDAAGPVERKAWQERIAQYEAIPPKGTWQMIAEQLDVQKENNGWPTRIYHHEATPPPGVWEAIAANMDADAAPVVTIAQKRVRKIGWLRIAAAAVILLAVAGTALWVMRDQFFGTPPQTIAANDGAPAAPVQPNKDSNGNMAVVEPVQAPVAALPTPVEPVAKTSAKKTPSARQATVDMAPMEYVSNKEMGFMPADAVFTNTNKLPNAKGQTIVEINGMDAPNSQYINISGPDGQSIRVSAKFASLLGYLNEGPDKEERLDRIIKESAYWKATFKQWREKMINTNTAPSLSNFMDVAELAKMLQ